MRAEILCVGTELLLGDIQNTNAVYASKRFAELGIDVYYQVVVGDNRRRLLGCIDAAYNSGCDLVLFTGGLGPTYDDITKEAVAEYFGVPLCDREDIREKIRQMLQAGRYPCTNNNFKQALVPEGAIVLDNERGTAPGLILEKDDRTAILLPGVPQEMEYLLDTKVTPYLEQKTHRTLVSRNVRFFGLGESAIEERLRSMMETSVNPTIAPYAKYGEVVVRVTASGEDKAACEALLQPVVKSICAEFPEHVYGMDEQSLPEALVNRLRAMRQTIATAESCTGGLVSARITDVPGASGVFKGGVCSYTDGVKEALLGVKENTLRQHGAVSVQTAVEMAHGIRRLCGSDFGVSTTGWAGPGGGTADTPVGTVFVAVAGPEATRVQELHLARSTEETRERVRHMAVLHALFNALKMVSKGEQLYAG